MTSSIDIRANTPYVMEKRCGGSSNAAKIAMSRVNKGVAFGFNLGSSNPFRNSASLGSNNPFRSITGDQKYLTVRSAPGKFFNYSTKHSPKKRSSLSQVMTIERDEDAEQKEIIDQLCEISSQLGICDNNMSVDNSEAEFAKKYDMSESSTIVAHLSKHFDKFYDDVLGADTSESAFFKITKREIGSRLERQRDGSRAGFTYHELCHSDNLFCNNKLIVIRKVKQSVKNSAHAAEMQVADALHLIRDAAAAEPTKNKLVTLNRNYICAMARTRLLHFCKLFVRIKLARQNQLLGYELKTKPRPLRVFQKEHPRQPLRVAMLHKNLRSNGIAMCQHSLYIKWMRLMCSLDVEISLAREEQSKARRQRRNALKAAKKIAC